MCNNHFRLAVLITLWLSAPFSNGQTRSPNIILILADDQGWGTTSVLMDEQVKESASDYYRTPNLEALAKKGVVFSSGYSPHSNCLGFCSSSSGRLLRETPAEKGIVYPGGCASHRLSPLQGFPQWVTHNPGLELALSTLG